MRSSAHNGMWMLLIAFLLVAFASTSALAQGKPFYISVKPGVFVPQGDIEDFGTGAGGELAFGRQYNKNIAVEMDVGWYNLHKSGQISVAVQGTTYSASGSADLDIIPIALTFKGILPFDRFELYGLAGIGPYYVRTEIRANAIVNGLPISASSKENDVVAGFTFGLGLNYNISQSWFVGAEGKYLFTTDATLYGIDTNLNGFTVTGVVGFRF